MTSHLSAGMSDPMCLGSLSSTEYGDNYLKLSRLYRLIKSRNEIEMREALVDRHAFNAIVVSEHFCGT